MRTLWSRRRAWAIDLTVATVLVSVSYASVAQRGGRPSTGLDSPEVRAGFRGENPKARTAYRLQRLKGKSGQYDPNDLVRARAHKRSMAENPRLFAVPGAPTTAALGPWEELGPGNIGGRTRAIVVHPTTPDIMYLGSASGGVWKTTNGGASWTPLDDMMSNLGIRSLIMDPRNPSVLYAGTGEAFRGAGIFKTVNGGASWTQIPSTATPDFHYVNQLSMSPTDSNVLLAATGSGLHRSTDAGATWSLRSSGHAEDVEFHPTNASRAVAGGSFGEAWWSNNGGASWTRADGIPPETGRVELTYFRGNPNVVLASVDNNNGELYRSDNGGASYVLRSTGQSLLGGQGFYDNTIWVHPTDENTLLVGGVDLHRTADGGATWQNAGFQLHVDQHAITPHPQFASNGLLFIGNDGGIFRYHQPTGDALELNNNLRITQFYAGGALLATSFVGGGTQDNGNLLYRGDPEGWKFLSGGDGGYIAFDPLVNPDGSWFVYTNNQGWTGPARARFDANGMALQGDDLTGGVMDNSLFIPPMVLDPNDHKRLYKGGNSLWRVRHPRYTTTTPMARIKEPGSVPISAITVAPGNSDLIWVADIDGQIFVTHDGTAAAPTWERKDVNGLPQLRACSHIAVDPFDHDRVYVSYVNFESDNIWRSEDGGETWTDISGNLPDLPIYALALWPYESGKVYIGTELGVFGSENFGATWSPTNQGPANVAVDDLFWMNNRLVAATHGRGMFRATVDIPPNVTITSPAADPQPFRAGIPVNLAAAASDGNGSVTRVEFFAGDTSLGVDTSSPYTTTWANPPAGTHRLTARATDNDGNVTTSAAISLGSAPPPWSNQDLGSVAVAGSALPRPNEFVLRGSGADIWGTADAFHFLHRPLAGNGQIVVRVASLQNTDPFAKAGVMIRESLAPNARNAFMGLTAASGATFQTRTATGGSTTSNRTTGFAAPYWVRLVRNGNTFTGYRSQNGTTWIQQGSPVTIAMASDALIGLAVTSHNNGVSTSASFLGVSVISGNRNALLVVGSTTLGVGDAAIRDRLQGLGYTLTIKTASAAVTGDATGKVFVLVTSTGSSSATSTKFRNVPVPVIVQEAFIFDDMGMTGPVADTDYGNESFQTQIGMTDHEHPLAAGLPGYVTTHEQPGIVNWAVPALGANVVAVLPGTGRAMLFTYEAGAQMVGLTAPARRVGNFAFDLTAASFTLEGWLLFDAAIRWAAGTP
jgi:hypothetical protein